MQLLITGSRDIGPEGLRHARKVVERAKANGWSIIVGDASGIDEAVINACYELQVEVTVYGAYGRMRRRTKTGSNVALQVQSYTDRDLKMVEHCDGCHAIWNGSSRGTKYTYDAALKTGKKAWLKQF